MQELTEMAASWFTVGAFLKGIEYYQLEAIEKDNRDQSMQCLREMLATWLKETDMIAGLKGWIRLENQQHLYRP